MVREAFISLLTVEGTCTRTGTGGDGGLICHNGASIKFFNYLTIDMLKLRHVKYNKLIKIVNGNIFKILHLNKGNSDFLTQLTLIKNLVKVK